MADPFTPPEGVPRRGFLAHLTGLYSSPEEAFRSLLRPAAFVVPLLALVALNVVFTAVWTQKADPREFMQTQIEESGRADRIPPDRRAAVVESQARLFPVFAWLGGLLGAALTVLVVASLYLFVFRFILGSEVTFKQSLAVVAWPFLAVSLLTTPLTLLIMALKGDWNLDPRTVLQANLSAILDKQSTPAALYSLAESLDLFSFWLLWLLSVGYGVAAGRRAGWAAPGVVGLWIVYVLGKMGLAAVF